MPKYPYIITIRYSDFSMEDRMRCILLLNAVDIKISEEDVTHIYRYIKTGYISISLDVHVLTKKIEYNYMALEYNKTFILNSLGKRMIIETFAEFLKILNYIKNPGHDTLLQYINGNNI